jgi:peroxiredoxin
MQALQSTYAPEGLTVVAVNVDRERRAADRFLAQYPARFELRFDPEGSLAETYQVRGMPTSLLIDRQGKVRYTHIGFRPIDGAIYERQVRELLEEK